ncbi:MAG TPA: HAMP domain-containing sensor histidine kinase [Candidatus Angelobacter sp.]|nr:HAMP domain-containing sensor histidine kinase [Candidatus Angelobacter sp.]
MIEDGTKRQIDALEAENAALKEELEESRRSTTQYLQNVAHQLTAPLGAIKWSIEALKDEAVPIQRKGKLLSSIYSQGTILVHLIKNFSLMSNLEADHELGQFRDKPERVDPLRLAINLANDFQPQAAEGGKKIYVNENSFKEIFDGTSILVVKNLIAQALSNLLENAVKYSNLRTAIYIEAQEVKLPEDNELFLAISVRSIGIAISSHEIKKLHNRGFRGSTAKQKIPAGTGIGLYIAKRIMDLHEGLVLVRTNGNETIVLLCFPQSRVQ